MGYVWSLSRGHLRAGGGGRSLQDEKSGCSVARPSLTSSLTLYFLESLLQGQGPRCGFLRGEEALDCDPAVFAQILHRPAWPVAGACSEPRVCSGRGGLQHEGWLCLCPSYGFVPVTLRCVLTDGASGQQSGVGSF